MAQSQQPGATPPDPTVTLLRRYGVYDTDTWIETVNTLTNTGQDEHAKELYDAGMGTFCPHGRARTQRLEAQRLLAHALLFRHERKHIQNRQAFEGALQAAELITSGMSSSEASRDVYIAQAHRCYGAWLAFEAHHSPSENLRAALLQAAIHQLRQAERLFLRADESHYQFLVATVFVLAKCILGQNEGTRNNRRAACATMLNGVLRRLESESQYTLTRQVTEYEIRACMLLGKLLWWDAFHHEWWSLGIGGNFQASREWRKRALRAIHRFERIQAKQQNKRFRPTASYRRALWLRRLPVPIFDLFFGQRNVPRPEV